MGILLKNFTNTINELYTSGVEMQINNVKHLVHGDLINAYRKQLSVILARNLE